MKVTQTRLRELLNYDPDTGIFIWKESRGGRQPGTVAGHLDYKGYVRLSVDHVLYRAHRLAWVYVYGVDPSDQIDHINGCRSDNRICNLRDVPNKKNAENQKLRKTNKSGHRGISWSKVVNKWQAGVCHYGEITHVGYFDVLDDAIAAVKTARDQLFTHHKTEYSA